MKSPLFEPETREGIERKVRDLLNEQADFLSADTAESTRAAGDAIQSIIEDNFAEILGDLIGEYSASFARRAMADLAFKDKVSNYCVVDVKTHREGTAFNMPNLTSVDRLAGEAITEPEAEVDDLREIVALVEEEKGFTTDDADDTDGKEVRKKASVLSVTSVGAPVKLGASWVKVPPVELGDSRPKSAVRDEAARLNHKRDGV